MARKIPKSRIHANTRRRATALLSIPFILPVLGLLFLSMTQGVAGYSAPPSSGGALPPEGPLQQPIFDLHIYKTDGLYHVLPDSLITYTIYFSMTSGPTQTLYIIDHPSAVVTPMGNTEWGDLGGGDWRYPATDVITLTSGQSLSTIFTVSVPLTVPYGTQLDNSTTFSVTDADDATPEDNRYTDTDIVVPGFNFSYLPLVTKAYAP